MQKLLQDETSIEKVYKDSIKEHKKEQLAKVMAADQTIKEIVGKLTSKPIFNGANDQKGILK